MLLRLDPRAAMPIHAQISAALRSQIAAGAITPGDRLPPARIVAEGLDVNLHTVLKAYATLEGDGLVEMRRGRGGVVVLDPPRLDPMVRDLAEAARRSGLTLRQVVRMLEEAW